MSATTPAQAQENEASGEYATARLCDVELRVKPVTAWRPSYLRALREGNYDGWAAGVLHEEDVQTFIDLDATFQEINEFTAEAMETAGEAPGKSGAPSRPSKVTRRR